MSLPALPPLPPALGKQEPKTSAPDFRSNDKGLPLQQAGLGYEVPQVNPQPSYPYQNSFQQSQPVVQPQQNYYQPDFNPYPNQTNQPGWLLPQGYSNASSTMKTVAFAVGSLVAVALVAILAVAMLNFGITGAVISIFLACFPFGLIFLCLVWMGKWDSEPWGLRIAAFLWGGAGAVIMVFAVTGLMDEIFGTPTSDLIASSIQAPFIEEFSKGIAVLMVALFLRKYIDGPVDGLVYIASIAAGFAFTENILYFGSAYAHYGLEGITQTFFVRAIMSPFAHVVFSLPMGIIVGFARSRGFSRPKTILVWLAVYPLSVTLHGLWNGSSSVLTGSDSWFFFYGLLEFPIFAFAMIGAILLRRHEVKLTFFRLTEYGRMGWFTPMEVNSFATWEGRRNALRWAKWKSPHAGDIMKEITRDVVDLSYNRERIVRGNTSSELHLLEQKLLDNLVKNKNYLLTL